VQHRDAVRVLGLHLLQQARHQAVALDDLRGVLLGDQRLLGLRAAGAPVHAPAHLRAVLQHELDAPQALQGHLPAPADADVVRPVGVTPLERRRAWGTLEPLPHLDVAPAAARQHYRAREATRAAADDDGPRGRSWVLGRCPLLLLPIPLHRECVRECRGSGAGGGRWRALRLGGGMTAMMQLFTQPLSLSLRRRLPRQPRAPRRRRRAEAKRATRVCVVVVARNRSTNTAHRRTGRGRRGGGAERTSRRRRCCREVARYHRE